MTWGKALAISEATSALPDDAAQAVEAHVLKRAAKQTHRNLLESLRRQVAKHTTAKQADEHRDAVAERTCKIVPLPNGMAGLCIVHTADMEVASRAVESGAWQPLSVRFDDLPSRFGYRLNPAPA